MPIPATSCQFRTNLQDMQIGDYIAFKAVGTSGVAPVISEIGAELATAQANEIPVAGSATPNGYAYAIKVDKGLCIADRVVQHSVSWDVLNLAKLIQGSIYTYKRVPLGTPFASLNSAVYPYDASGAFNGLIGTNDHWYCGGSIGDSGYLGYIFDDPTVIREIKLMCQETYPNENFKNFTIEASNDTTNGHDGTWDLLKDNLNMSGIVLKYDIFYIKSNIPYKAVRIRGLTTGRGYIQVTECLINPKDVTFRSLTGGNSYLGVDGKLALTDQNLGAFPPKNEWDRYIVNSNLGGKIIAGDDNVWHWAPGQSTLCQGTPVNNLTATNDTGSSGMRIQRGRYIYNGTTYGPNINSIDVTTKAIGYDGIGFRPVFQFLELNSKATNLFY